MEELVKKIKSAINLSTKAEEYLISISKEQTVPKGSILIREGQAVNKIFFVAGGCLRSYCTDKNGKEHTLLFTIKNWWVSDYIAIYSDEYAKKKMALFILKRPIGLLMQLKMVL